MGRITAQELSSSFTPSSIGAANATHASEHAPGASDTITSHYLANTDYTRQPAYGVTSGTSTAYIISTSPALASYTDGICVTIERLS